MKEIIEKNVCYKSKFGKFTKEELKQLKSNIFCSKKNEQISNENYLINKVDSKIKESLNCTQILNDPKKLENTDKNLIENLSLADVAIMLKDLSEKINGLEKKVDDKKNGLKKEVVDELVSQVKKELEQELVDYVKSQVKEELKKELVYEVKSQVKKELEQELVDYVKSQVKEELNL